MAEVNKKTILVTGGSRGIGRAICQAFAADDTNIFFNYYSPDAAAEKIEADKTEKQVADAGGSASGIFGNVVSRDDMVSCFDHIMAQTGRIDVLVNNAGITMDGLILRMKDAQWERVLDINLKGAFICTQLAAKQMMRQKTGRIINMASVVGVTGNAGQANYSASKAGMIGLTKSTAQEFASRNITANAVAPGYIDTDMTAALSDKVKESILKMVPLKRMGLPEDIAAAVKFLASDAAAYITGQVLHVNGGMHM